MSKNIILLSDGTGNSSSTLFKTNVWRLYQALDTSTNKQIAFYDDGVGTSSFRPLAILGGILGLGLSRNVKELYTFLCRNYEKGDQIYCYGFSRGAFTIRLTVGLIACQGIINQHGKDDRELQRQVRDAYRAFRLEAFDNSILSSLSRGVMRGWQAFCKRAPYNPGNNIGYDGPPDKLIRFVGVWDTVDAYGLPIDEMTRAWDRLVWPLTVKEQELSSRVEKACHAIAIDDERETFHPVLWNEDNEPDCDTIDAERLTQIWFVGVHANVGGGYPDDALAHVSLAWMLDESTKAGLSFHPQEKARLIGASNPLGPLYDSRRGAAGYYRYTPRNIKKLTCVRKSGWLDWLKFLVKPLIPKKIPIEVGKPKTLDVLIPFPKIHHTVFERIQHGSDRYAPFNLPDRYAVVEPDGKIVRVTEPSTSASSRQWETEEQASQRYQAQEQAWNWVWLRRIAYFLTIGFTLVMIAFPFFASNVAEGKCASWPTCFLSGIPKFIGAFLPSFAQGWITAYQSHPGTFCLFALAIFILMLTRASLKATINNKMRRLWQHVITPGSAPVNYELGKTSQLLRNIRQHPVYQWPFRFVKGFVFELVFMLLFVAFVFVGASRAAFAMWDSTGQICAKASASQLVKPREHPETSVTRQAFPAREMCWATGFELVEGYRYRIMLKTNNEWKDLDVVADLGGWTPRPAGSEAVEAYEPWWGGPAAVLRRHLFEPWYLPVAKIGRAGMDAYPLRPAKPLLPKRDKRLQLSVDITARSTGPLYLYLNDAVFFTPSWSRLFYANNQGQASVEVSQLP